MPRHLNPAQNARAREELNKLLQRMRQQDVAKETGWDQGSISRKANGSNGFSAESARKLAEVAEIDPEIIFGDGTGPRGEPQSVAAWFRDRGAQAGFAEAISLHPQRWSIAVIAKTYAMYEGKLTTADEWIVTLDRWEGLAAEDQNAAGRTAHRRDVYREIGEQRQIQAVRADKSTRREQKRQRPAESPRSSLPPSPPKVAGRGGG